MHQISLIKSESDMLTAEQRSAWARRGFLILKSFLSPAQIERLSPADTPADGDRAAHKALVASLNVPVGQLLAAPTILFSLRRGVTEGLGLDALNPADGPIIRAATAVVMLESSDDAGWEHSFFAGSHLIPPADPAPDRGAEMFRIAGEIREQGLVRDVLQFAAGDVWLRHPRLVRAVARRGRGTTVPRWLTASFGGAEDLPKGWIGAGLGDAVCSARTLFAASQREIPSNRRETKRA